MVSKNEIFAIDNEGHYIAKIKLIGIRFKDAEDITISKCENGKNCLVVGDVGNNKGDRKQLKLYSVPEPYLDHYEEFKEFSFIPKLFDTSIKIDRPTTPNRSHTIQ